VPFGCPTTDFDKGEVTLTGFPGSILGKFWTGAEIRRPAKEGMDVDNLFTAVDGGGTGVAFGERADILGFRTVLISLEGPCLTDDAVDGVDKRVVDWDKRVDVSDGVPMFDGP